MDWLRLPGRQIEIAVAPVSRADYARFVQETRNPIPPRTGAATSAVTWVSAEEACAFAAWLSKCDVYRYRLPTLDDMLALAAVVREGGSVGTKPVNLRPTVAEDGPSPPSEWLQCVPDCGDGRLGLHCVANVSWLCRAGRASTRGALSEGRYSFVTFRLVRTSDDKESGRCLTLGQDGI